MVSDMVIAGYSDVRQDKNMKGAGTEGRGAISELSYR